MTAPGKSRQKLVKSVLNTSGPNIREDHLFRRSQVANAVTGHKNRYPPGPFALTEIRHYAGGSYADTADHLLSCARRYGPIWSFRFFNKRIYVLNDADAIRTVLVEKQHLFAKNRRKRLKPIMGEGLLLSDGPLHVRQRRIMQPAFHRCESPTTPT